MPSVNHQLLVDLFRKRGELAPALLQRCAGLELAHHRIEPRPADLSQVASTEYRADSVIELRAHDDALVAAVIVEVQLRRDADKPYSWPVYIAALRAELRCPAILLVVTTKRAVARWARRPISLGHPGLCLTPVVVGFHDLPRIVDREDAVRLPELAVLSAMAHPELAVAEVAVHAIGALPEDLSRLYLDAILARLPDTVRRLLEDTMQGHEYRSEFARRYYSQGREAGREEGREAGREEGREAGREEGREAGLRAAVHTLLAGKVELITADDEAALAALHDERSLTALVAALGAARDAVEARAAVTRASFGFHR